MNKSFILGAVAAAGAVMLLPGVAAGMARAGRPLARAAAKTGAVAFEEFRKASAEAFEQFEDLAAEIREDLDTARVAEGQPADPPATEDSLRDAPTAGQA